MSKKFFQVAGAINSTMAGISSVTGIANRAGQVAGFAQGFTGGGGGGSTVSSIDMGSVVHRGPAVQFNSNSPIASDMLIAPNTPNIGFVSQNGIKASPYMHTPPAKFAMSAQNARYFNQKLPGGGGGGGNGGIGGGGGVGGY